MANPPHKSVCPLVRDIKPNVAYRYIGRLNYQEFDLLDWFRLERRLCDHEAIADAMKWTHESARRYIRFMGQAGILGFHRVERRISVKYASNNPFGRQARENYEHENTHVVNLAGPTMKGMHMWHDALGEEWDWKEYAGAPWITIEGLPTGLPAPASWKTRPERSVA